MNVNWELLIQLGTLVVSCVALVQIKLARETLADTAYANANGWMLQLDQAFLAKPHLRPYFFGGCAVTPDDKLEAEAMAEYMLDTFDFFLKHRFREVPLQESWRNWMFDCLDKSPLLQANLAARGARWFLDQDSALGRLYAEWRMEHPAPPSAPNPPA